jgi:DinB superfamily
VAGPVPLTDPEPGRPPADRAGDNADVMEPSEHIRRQLIELLEAEGAHMPFEAAVADFPAEGINRRVPDADYTPWHLLEHIRFAQVDILDYIRDRAYLEPTWPDEYWPPRDATATLAEFRATLDAFRRDRAALRDLVADPATDLFAVLPDTPGHTIFREIRIVGAHNAYHIGEFAILRQVMGTWPPGRTE